MVYTERAETAAVSRGTSHLTTQQRCQYTTSVDTQTARYKKKKLKSLMRQKRSESARERRTEIMINQSTYSGRDGPALRPK